MAFAEYLSHHRHFGFPDSTAMPFVMVGFKAALQRSVDLTERKGRKALGVSLARMLDHAWRAAAKHESLSQVLGRLAFEADIEAILGSSAADRGGVTWSPSRGT
jgi:hypothetical protein